jgi:hypothetical protein
MHARPEIMDHALKRSLQAEERAPDRDLPDRYPEGPNTRTDLAHLYASSDLR